jgi:hypothetical protein
MAQGVRRNPDLSRALRSNGLSGRPNAGLGVPEDPERWCGPLYQTANRLARLHWLTKLGVRAWFVHLLFFTTRTNRHVPRTGAPRCGQPTRSSDYRRGSNGPVTSC